MRIVVLVKEVPDTYGTRTLDVRTGLLDRVQTENLIDEIDERALEVALQHLDSDGSTEIVVLAMGPDSASATLKKALALGAHRAVHLCDDALVGADYLTTADALSAAIGSLEADLVLAGSRSTDGGGGVIPTMIAEKLNMSALTNVSSVVINNDEVTADRTSEFGTASLSSPLPAVVSVTEQAPEARFASFKGIMAAKKKPVDRLSLSDLGIALDLDAEAHSIVLEVRQRPQRSGGIKVLDEGDAAAQLAEFLISSRLV